MNLLVKPLIDKFINSAQSIDAHLFKDDDGTPILAAADGTAVVASYDADGYGFYVKLKHDDTYSTVYVHCSALLVSVGQTVKQGQIIAKVGSTGYSTGNHLHFEVIQNRVRVNALNFYE